MTVLESTILGRAVRGIDARGVERQVRKYDMVEVDPRPYLPDGPARAWCQVTDIAPGTAASWPIKVQIPGRGWGQYKLAEIEDWHRPALIREVERLHEARGGRPHDASFIVSDYEMQ